jgi:hypothetical protein
MQIDNKAAIFRLIWHGLPEEHSPAVIEMTKAEFILSEVEGKRSL